MRSAEYRRAVAEVLCEAALQGTIERHYRIGRGARKVMQDAAQISVAFYLVDLMVGSPYWTNEPRLFMAVEPLEPELSLCVTELRRMLDVERILARSDERLEDLRARVSKVEDSVELPVPVRERL